mmetsp:Transcript_3101/g.8890  ORF Transcript_3101/g.8890 Transcript_3101/m.8890 type:complete len:319 (+) Transcript_3101:58-1014(+)
MEEHGGGAGAAPGGEITEAQSVERRQTAAALGLLQRLPPQDLEANIAALSKIAPHLEKALEPYVTRPLQLKRDPENNLYFVACEYNCDGGTHRSPWSNAYVPAPPGGEAEEALFRPSERLRRLEETFNEVFDAYKTMYYDGGVSSVYLWDLDEGFAGAFLIRKELASGSAADKVVEKGLWESVHMMEVRESASTSSVAEYKLSTTVRVHLDSSEPSKNENELGALVTRQAESRYNRGKKALGDDVHLLQMGKMIEDMEISIRQSLDSLQMAKQREVLNALRCVDGFADGSGQRRLAGAKESQVDSAPPAPVDVTALPA